MPAKVGKVVNLKVFQIAMNLTSNKQRKIIESTVNHLALGSALNNFMSYLSRLCASTKAVWYVLFKQVLGGGSEFAFHNEIFS